MYQSCEMSRIWQIYLCKYIGRLGCKVWRTHSFAKVRPRKKIRDYLGIFAKRRPPPLWVGTPRSKKNVG